MDLKFGLQFFPSVGPDERSAVDYFDDCLRLGEAGEALGYSHGRIVEHYFHPYGGYSPNPLIFLTALAQRTKTMRLITGALLPVFNNPLKMAGEIAMVDALSKGRLDVGFARAFLPHEFRRFGISPDESVARYREGVEQLDLLLSQESVSHQGKFHVIENTTSLPRPTQKPRPKFYVAALSSADTFEFAGRNGYSIMAIPMGGGKVREFLNVYREAWRKAGHPGNGEVMLAFFMHCESDGEAARNTARPYMASYFKRHAEASSDWLDGMTSSAYPGYDKIMKAIRDSTMESQIASGSAWIGSPEDIRRSIEKSFDEYGVYEHASLQVNPGLLPTDVALKSMALFAAEVMPYFSQSVAKPAAAAGDTLPPAYRSELDAKSLSPLWDFLQNALPRDRPAGSTKAHRWSYKEIRGLLLRAGDIVPLEKAERRVLIMSDPGRGPRTMQTTGSIEAALQLLLPGEFAEPHRHTPSAARLLIEGEGAYTIVNGRKCTMERGDVILTPSMQWHSHGHDGTEPVVWLDLLDMPAVTANEAAYVEPGYEGVNAANTLANRERDLLAVGLADPAQFRSDPYPQLRYAWRDTRAALLRKAALRPGEVVELSYVNPETGDSCLPLIGFTAMYLPAGVHTVLPLRSCCSIFHVIDGSGSSAVDGGSFSWETADTFSAPTFARISHTASQDGGAFLMRIDDAPMQRKLGLYDERKAS